MAQPTYGAPWDPLADVYGQHWVFEPLTSDPSSTTEGDLWLRTDMDSGDKLATLRFDHGSGIWDIPVFAVGESGGNVEEVLRVQTPNGLGFVPLADSNAAFSQLGFQHNATRFSLHDSAIAIPDSVINRWPIDEGSGTTLADVIGSADMTISGATWETNTDAIGGQWLSFDGTDDEASNGSASPSPASMTMAVTVRVPNTVSDIQTVYQFGSGSSTGDGIRLIHFRGDQSQNLVVFAVRADDANYYEVGGVQLSPGGKYRIVGVVDDSAKELRIAVNGTVEGTTDVSGVSFNTVHNDGVALGVDLGTASEYYEGYIDEPLHADTAWDSQTIQDDYERHKAENVLSIQAHQQHTLSLSPMGEHFNGVTYVTYGNVNSLGVDDGMDIIVGAYDHSTNDYTTTTLGQVYADNHYLSSITVDNSGYIWVSYDWRESHDDGNNVIVRSDNTEDISSFSQVHTGTENRSYGVFAVSDGDIHHFHREGGSPRDLFVSYSTDGGSSWSEDRLISLTDRWCYPGQSYVDGTDIHLAIRGRDQTSAGHIAGHVVYDAANKTLRGTDGTDLPEPASESDLNSADSVIVSSADPAGTHSVVVDGGNPRVSYREGNELKFAEYAGGSWSRSVVDTYPGSATAGFITDSNGSDITVHETWLSNLGNDFTLGEYTSSDGGSTWSSRSVGRSFGAWPLGPNVVKPINNASADVKLIAIEQTNVDTIESAGAEIRLLDSNLDDVEIS